MTTLQRGIRSIVAAALLTVVLAAPAQASYVHLRICKQTLAGHAGSDNDTRRIHRITGLHFVEFGHGWHIGGDAYVLVGFVDNGGGVHWFNGRCWGGDFHGDTIG